MSDILTENTTCGYDSGVDCCERPVSDEHNDHNNLEPAKSTEHTNSAISVAEFYGNVACNSMKPPITDESIVPEQKSSSQSDKQMKPIRKKKRRHLLTVRRRKNRFRNDPLSCEQTAGTHEQITNAREQTVNEREGNRSAADIFSDIQGMAIGLSSLAAVDHLSNSQLHLGNTSSVEMDTQHDIVNITDHVSDDIVHVSDECQNIIVESNQDSPMHVESVVSELNGVLYRTNRVNNEEIDVDDCMVSHSSNVIFLTSHVNNGTDDVTCGNDDVFTEIKQVTDMAGQSRLVCDGSVWKSLENTELQPMIKHCSL